MDYPGQITNVPKARAADVDKISDRFVEDGFITLS